MFSYTTNKLPYVLFTFDDFDFHVFVREYDDGSFRVKIGASAKDYSIGMGRGFCGLVFKSYDEAYLAGKALIANKASVVYEAIEDLMS